MLVLKLYIIVAKKLAGALCANATYLARTQRTRREDWNGHVIASNPGFASWLGGYRRKVVRATHTPNVEVT